MKRITVGDVLESKKKPTQPVKKWISPAPTECQMCESELKEVFYDARMCYGSWALLCEGCFDIFGVGLGLGRGQKYRLDTLEKVGG